MSFFFFPHLSKVDHHSCATTFHFFSPSSPVRICQMPAELLRFPVQAVKVKVAGLKPRSAGPQEFMLPYSPEWSMRATMDMVDLLHGSITASVVVRENKKVL